MNLFFRQRALGGRWLPSQVRKFFILLDVFIPIPIQTCASPLVYPTGKQAPFHFMPRNFELETV
jgi:hypothetical protein